MEVNINVGSSDYDLAMPEIGLWEFPRPQQVHGFEQDKNDNCNGHVEPASNIQNGPKSAYLYLRMAKIVPQGRTMTSQHSRSSRMKDMVAMKRPMILQMVFFVLLDESMGTNGR